MRRTRVRKSLLGGSFVFATALALAACGSAGGTDASNSGNNGSNSNSEDSAVTAVTLDDATAVDFIKENLDDDEIQVDPDQSGCVLTGGDRNGPTAEFMCLVVSVQGPQISATLTCDLTPDQSDWSCIYNPDPSSLVEFGKIISTKERADLTKTDFAKKLRPPASSHKTKGGT